MLLFLKSIDMFGVSYKFTFNGEERFRHHFGGLLTLMFILIAAYLVYVIGFDLIVKDNPYTFSSTNYNYQREINPRVNFSISFQDWTTRQPVFRDLIEEGYLRVVGLYKNGKGEILKQTLFRKCEYSDFLVKKTLFDERFLDYSYCPMEKFINQTVNCKYRESKALYITIEIGPCQGIRCKSEQEITDYLQKRTTLVTFHNEQKMYYPDYTLTFNPTEASISESTHKLNPSGTSQVFYNYKMNLIDSDLQILGYGSFQFQYTNLIFRSDLEIKRDPFYSNSYLNFVMYANPYELKNNRRFIKITELISQTGSLLNIISIALAHWVKLIYKLRMKEILMNKVFYMNSNDDVIEKIRNPGQLEEENLNIKMSPEEKGERIKLIESNLKKNQKGNPEDCYEENNQNQIDLSQLPIKTEQERADERQIILDKKTDIDVSMIEMSPRNQENKMNNNFDHISLQNDDQNNKPEKIDSNGVLTAKAKISNSNHVLFNTPSPLNNQINNLQNNPNIHNIINNNASNTNNPPTDTNDAIIANSPVDLVKLVSFNPNTNTNINTNTNSNIKNDVVKMNSIRSRNHNQNNDMTNNKTIIELNTPVQKTCCQTPLTRTDSKKKKIVEEKFNLLKPIHENESLLSTTNLNSEKAIHLLSMSEYVTLICCKCFANPRIKEIKGNYDKLEPIISQYSDIVFNVRKTYDLEKLQFILFDKTQIAIFNSNQKIDNPMNVVAKGRFAQFYQFIKNNRAQESVYKEYYKNLSENKKKKKNKFDKKLIDLMKKSNK